MKTLITKQNWRQCHPLGGKRVKDYRHLQKTLHSATLDTKKRAVTLQPLAQVATSWLSWSRATTTQASVQPFLWTSFFLANKLESNFTSLFRVDFLKHSVFEKAHLKVLSYERRASSVELGEATQRERRRSWELCYLWRCVRVACVSKANFVGLARQVRQPIAERARILPSQSVVAFLSSQCHFFLLWTLSASSKTKSSSKLTHWAGSLIANFWT